jgi:Domain of unknown function (DUF1906)
MRTLVSVCGVIVAIAAMVWIPIRSHSRQISASADTSSAAGSPVSLAGAEENGPFPGFDRNIYPGDDALPILRKTFAYAGFWVGPPPGEKINTWKGKRELMKSLGFGFAVLYRARAQNEVKKDAVAKQKAVLDAKAASEGAKSEGFAPNSVIFLDIEDGGRLPPTFHTYLRAWADELVRAGYRPGVYCSGIPNDTDQGIRTSDDIKNHMGDREFVYWVFNDFCPPAPGCVASKTPHVRGGGVPYAAMWQYAQSPRRKERTAKCSSTYNADGDCYAPGDTAHAWFLDLNSAKSADPSSAPAE